MSQIFIRHNFSRISVALEGISGQTLRRAVSRSIKRVTKTVAKVASQEIRARRLINMRATVLKRRIRVFDSKASASRQVSDQYGEVHISGRAESMARFFAKRQAVGRSPVNGARLSRVLVSEQGRPYLDQSKSFIVGKGAGAEKVVLARVGSKRLPVQKVTGPSIGKLANDSGLLEGLRTVAASRYETEFSHNLDFYAQQAIEKAKGS